MGLDFSNFPMPTFTDAPFTGATQPPLGSGSAESGLGVMNLSDLPDYTAPARQVFPKGTYPATCKSVTFGVSKSSHNKMWTWTFKAFNPQTSKETTVWYYTALENIDPEKQRDALGRLKNTIKAVAPDLTQVNLENPGDTFIDRPCQLKLKIDKNQSGDPVNSIDFDGVLPAGPRSTFN